MIIPITILNSSEAVSYTHLDVYKRQLWYSVKSLIHVYLVIQFITAWITLTFIFIVKIIWKSFFVICTYSFHVSHKLFVCLLQISRWESLGGPLTHLSYCLEKWWVQKHPQVYVAWHFSVFLSVLYLNHVGYFCHHIFNCCMYTVSL